MSDGRYSVERHQISKNDDETLTDVDEEYEEIDKINKKNNMVKNQKNQKLMKESRQKYRDYLKGLKKKDDDDIFDTDIDRETND